MKKIREILYLTFLLSIPLQITGQNEVKQDGYKTFFYPGGQKASEGLIRSGRPDGFWISYYPTGIKKSEGNRRNFLLDSTWIFFSQWGDTTEKINYLLGKKNGYSYKYGFRTDGVGKDRMVLLSKELYLNDKLEGNSYYFFSDGKLREIIKYSDGQKNGQAFEFNKDSVIIAVYDYRRNYLILSERVNRIDSSGVKQGLWREYYPDGKLKTESFYKNGLLSGIYKQFNAKGALELSLNYVNGKIDASSNLSQKEVSIKNTYDENNILTFSGAFLDSIPVGIHRFYNKDGKVINAKVFSNTGLLLSEGVITNEGKREGPTRFFFENEKVYSTGDYMNNQRTGKWVFYFPSGRVEQEGYYKNDLADGSWKWYFPDGQLKREEEYLAGKEDGQYTEYDLLGNVITTGSYVEGEKEGEWTYKVGDHSEVGKYISGLRDGVWKYYYGDGQIQFEGSYVQGNLNGWVYSYYSNGKRMEEDYYENGIRQKTWKKYDLNGNIVLTITYLNDAESRINGEKIEEKSPEVKLIK